MSRYHHPWISSVVDEIVPSHSLVFENAQALSLKKPSHIHHLSHILMAVLEGSLNQYDIGPWGPILQVFEENKKRRDPTRDVTTIDIVRSTVNVRSCLVSGRTFRHGVMGFFFLLWAFYPLFLSFPEGKFSFSVVPFYSPEHSPFRVAPHSHSTG